MKKCFCLALTVCAGSYAFSAETTNKNEVRLAVQIVNGPTGPLRTATTLWGSTGLIFVPTAYTIGEDNLNFGMALTKDFSSFAGNYGIFRDVEVGGAYLDRNGANNKAIANAKVRIVPANFRKVDIGIGIMDAFDAVNQTVYIVGSVDVVTPPAAAEEGAVGLRLHGGVGTGYFSEKLFGGGELFFTRGFSALGEWDTKNFNFAARYAHSDEFFISAGIYATRPMVKMSYLMRF